MDTKGGIRIDAVILHVLKEILIAVGKFFAAFKDEVDRAVDLILLLLQDLQRAQQHGGVTVMSAGMHQSLFFRDAGTGPLHILGRLRNGQGIDISAKQNAPTGLAAGNTAQNAAFFHFDVLQTHAVQFFADLSDGSFLFSRHVGESVEPAAHFNDIWLVFLSQFQSSHIRFLPCIRISQRPPEHS